MTFLRIYMNTKGRKIYELIVFSSYLRLRLYQHAFSDCRNISSGSTICLSVTILEANSSAVNIRLASQMFCYHRVMCDYHCSHYKQLSSWQYIPECNPIDTMLFRDLPLATSAATVFMTISGVFSRSVFCM